MTVQDPHIIQGLSHDPHGEQETHPAYGQVSVGRSSISHPGSYLYGSDFGHTNVVTLRISESVLQRSLNRDWYHAADPIVEIALTEAQWATLVSSFNQGSGVPCTLTYRSHIPGDGLVPDLPVPDRTSKYRTEVKETTDGVSDTLKDLDARLRKGVEGLSKKKADELLGLLGKARRAVDDSLPFIQEQFEEHMEETIEKAKAEVHGYLSNQINRAGLAALGAQDDLLRLPDDTVKG